MERRVGASMSRSTVPQVQFYGCESKLGNPEAMPVLEGLRVLDLTDESGWLAGKILGDMGADVIAIEPPGGDLAAGAVPTWATSPIPSAALPGSR